MSDSEYSQRLSRNAYPPLTWYVWIEAPLTTHYLPKVPSPGHLPVTTTGYVLPYSFVLPLAICYYWLCATIGYVLLLAMCYYWLCATIGYAQAHLEKRRREREERKKQREKV